MPQFLQYHIENFGANKIPRLVSPIWRINILFYKMILQKNIIFQSFWKMLITENNEHFSKFLNLF